MTHICRFLFVVALTALAFPAHAADVVFPPGSRIGLAPPPGVATSRNFFGFEDASNNVAIVIVGLPPEAYADIEKSTAADAPQRQGLIIEKHEALAFAGGKAFLVIARQEAEAIKLHKWIMAASTPEMTVLVTVQIPDAAQAAYPEAAIRAAFASVAIRPTVPIEEQLGLLPFRVGDLAGFQVGGVLPGRALMLTDATTDLNAPNSEPHFVIAIAPGGPAQNGDRSAFARDVFGTIPNLKDVRLSSSEPLRIGGQQGYQIMAQGKDNATGSDVTIVQWLRFGSGAYMHMVGVARTDAWIKAYARFRQVRDTIDTP